VDLRDYIRDIPDFPKAGIVFKDITPLLLAPAAFDHAVGLLADHARPLGVDLIVAAEARGFIFGGALARGTRILVHDDLLATGGTAKAKVDLVEQLGGRVVGCAFVVELAFLPGRETLAGYDVHALVRYDAP
jgi:adenine phosphoribosyltransferase